MTQPNAPAGPAGEQPPAVDTPLKRPPADVIVSALLSAPPTPTPPPAPSPLPTRYTPQFSSSSTQAILCRFSSSSVSAGGTPSLGNGPSADGPRTMLMPALKLGREEDEAMLLSVSLEAESSSSLSVVAVCIVCARPARSLFNPLVPCRRCDRRWHRLCHEPVIADYVAAAAAAEAAAVTEREPTNSTKAKPTKPRDGDNHTWSCPPCTAAAAAEYAERLAQRARANRIEGSLRVPAFPQKSHSLANFSLQKRQAYLASLPRRDLAQWLLHAVEKHPDLAVFPDVDRQGDEKQHRHERPAGQPARPRTTLLPPLPPSVAGSSSENRLTAAAVMAASRNNPKYRNGIINSIRKSHAASVAAAAAAEKAEKAEKAAAARSSTLPAKRGRPPAQQTQPQPGQPPQHRIMFAKRPNGTNGVNGVNGTTPNGNGRASRPGDIPSFVPTPIDPDEEDPTGLMAGWPKPGQGLYARVGPDWLGDTDSTVDEGLTGAVLVDRKDHASFSSIVYNAAGRKVQENGLPVLVL